MHPTLSAAGPGMDAPGNEIAGRIDAPQTQIHKTVKAWLARLEARVAPATLRDYRQTVKAAIRAMGWARDADITADAVSGYLSQAKKARGWSPATYNRNLSVFKSLAVYMRRKHQGDAIETLDRAIADDPEGSRASTLAEARAHIRTAWIRGESDRRSKGNRALVWMCLFAHGCRAGEPELWPWARLILDEPVPFVDWTPELHKNRSRVTVAIAPELAQLLRRHRETVPHGPGDLVFPIRPPRTTFRADRDRAGIPVLDRRGRKYSPHSARKFFSTCLTAQGVPEKMVDFLMRHSGRTEHRYYDPTLAEQAAELAKLPRLWPEIVEIRGENSGGLTTPSDQGMLSEATPMHTVLAQLDQACRPRPIGVAASKAVQPAGPTEFSPSAGQRGHGTKSAQVRSTRYSSGNADSRTHNDGHNDLLADLLESTAALLRHGAADHASDPRESQDAS